MSVQLQTAIASGVALAVALTLVLARKRLGPLNATYWLVVLGALAVASEHAQFAISFTLPGSPSAPVLERLPHERLHFFMAGLYTLLGLVALCTLARTHLRAGRRVAWYTLLFTLVVGVGADLIVGAVWFQHGSPLYGLLGVQGHGVGWEFLDVYPVAWVAALAISYRPIFRARAPYSPERNLPASGLTFGASE